MLHEPGFLKPSVGRDCLFPASCMSGGGEGVALPYAGVGVGGGWRGGGGY
jgi:hypothetical protein